MKREFFGILTNPHTRAYYAAMYEAEQAERDFTAALDAFRATGARTGTSEDYAVWHAGGYADAAQRRVRDMSVWNREQS